MLRKLFGKKTAQPIISDKTTSSNDIETDQAEASQTAETIETTLQSEQSGQSEPAKMVAPTADIPAAMPEAESSIQNTAEQMPQMDKTAQTDKVDSLDFSLQTPPLGTSLPTNSQDLMAIANQNAQFWIEAGTAIQEYHLKCQQQQFKMMSEFMAQFTRSSQK